jgi:hypothetical protein
LGGCKNLHRLPPNVLTHCLHDWFEEAFSEHDHVTCDEWVEHDAFILTRHDALHAWHTLGDMWHSFLSAAVFNLEPLSSRVIFADTQTAGPALSFWTAAFKAAAPIALQQLAQESVRRGVRTLCFRRAIFNPPATTSALEQGYQHVGGRLACSDNVLLQAFATHVRALLGPEHAPPQDHSATLLLYILKHDDLPPSSRDLFARLQQHFSASLSITVASVKRTPLADIVSSLSRASILLATDDAAAAYALYLRPLSACVSLQFADSPLLRMRLVTSWARISHYKFDHPISRRRIHVFCHTLSVAYSARVNCLQSTSLTRASAFLSHQESGR